MKIYDVIPLTPPETDPEKWSEVMKAAHGADHTYISTPDDRLGWLHRLVDEEVWGEAIVVTDRSQFPFWRLAPANVVVQSESGQKLGKPQRTTEIDDWAAGNEAHSIKKSEFAPILKKLRKTEHDQKWYFRWYDMWANSASNGQSLYETDGTYELITPGNFFEIREKILREIALGHNFCWDSETDQTNEEDSTSPNPWSARLVDISIGTDADPKHAYRMPVAHENAENFALGHVLGFLDACYNTAKDSGAYAVLHNCKYDYSVLCNPLHGLDANHVYREWLPLTIDTMLAAQVACMRPAGLKPLAKRYLGVAPIDFKKLTGGKSFALVPEEPANIYAGQDADWPLRLWPIISAKLQAFGPDTTAVYERRVRVTEFFMRAERRGMKLNVEKLQALQERAIELRALALNGLVTALINDGISVPDDFNPGSSVQLARVFFAARPEGLGLPVLVRTKTGAPSAGAKARNAMSVAGVHHPALLWLKAWSKQQKRITASTTPILTKFLQSDGRIHPTFGVCATETSRTSCQLPNAQQFDEELASCFEAEEDEETGRQGELADLDYSQIELRALAVVYDVKKMLETYQQPRKIWNDDGELVDNPDADIHERTRRELNLPPNERRTAKAFNFGKAFEGGDETLSIAANRPLSVIIPLSRAYDDAYPERSRNIGAAAYAAQQAGLVKTWEGWVRLLPPAISDKQRAENRRLVANTPVQGGAAGIIMTAIDDLLPLMLEAELAGIHPFNMIHDALYFEREPRVSDAYWHQFLQQVTQIMEDANPWADQIPIYADCKVGFNWGRDLHAPEYVDIDETEDLFRADFEPEQSEFDLVTIGA